MNHLHQPSDSITLVVSEVVKPDRVEDYEVWVSGINQAASQFNGYLGTSIIRPRDHTHPEYVTIVKFDNYDHFKIWQTSPVCQEWLSKVADLVVTRTRQQKYYEPELWFTLSPNALRKPSHPAYYKQVILGVMAVYPLILLANVTIAPFLKGLPPNLGLLISVCFVSALLTYPVMPWLTRSLDFWLYPKR